MSSFELGFIGIGNMGGALAKSAAKSGQAVTIADLNRDAADKMAKGYGYTVNDNATLAGSARFVFLGVKPQVMPNMLADIKSTLAERSDEFVLVTMAAGLKISAIREMAGGDYPVIRIMPNTPVSVNEGMILYTPSENVKKEQVADFLKFMQNAGKFLEITEEQMDAGCALSGCGPAFVDIFLDALAKGGEECGLPREKALFLAAQTLIGASKLYMESDKTPEELKIAVCSPGGATIEGVKVFESSEFENITKAAVKAAFDRSVELGK